MYFLGISGWFLVSSRFIAGIGSGVVSALFADISRITTVEDRTAVMSSFMAVRQFGLLIGKCCYGNTTCNIPGAPNKYKFLFSYLNNREVNSYIHY